jgi:hypothetical protein
MRLAIMIVVTFVGADGIPGMSRIHARNVAAGPTPLLWRKDGIFALSPAADIRSLFRASAGVVPCKIIYGLEIVLFGIACCSSKHDCNFSRFTGTRACAPFGAALKYCTGQETDCSSSCAARNGQ